MRLFLLVNMLRYCGLLRIAQTNCIAMLLRSYLKRTQSFTNILVVACFALDRVDCVSQSAMVVASLFPKVSCLVSLVCSFWTESFCYPRSLPLFFQLGPCWKKKAFLRAAGCLSDSPCRWCVNRPSAELVVDSLQLCFGHGSNKSSCFPDRFQNENEMHMDIGSRAPATFSEFAFPPRSHRAHAFSSVAKSSPPQLDMHEKLVTLYCFLKSGGHQYYYYQLLLGILIGLHAVGSV